MTVGLPRALSRWLGIVVALPLFALLGCAQNGALGGDAQPIIKVGPNVQVSISNANLVHRETLVAADPTNRNKLVACVVVLNRERNGQRTLVYRTNDSGLSWAPALAVGDENYNSNDPTCTFGASGQAFFGGFTYAWAQGLQTTFPQGGFVYTSPNGGDTWLRATPVGVGDRPFIVADANTASQFFGRVYINSSYEIQNRQTHAWDNYLAIFTSLNRGRTFGKPVLVAPYSGHGEVFNGNCATTSSGALACVFLSPKKTRPLNTNALIATSKFVGNSSLEVAISRDGGTRFAKPRVVGDAWTLFPSDAKISVIPYIAADDSSGAFRNRLYVVWTDVRSGRSEVLLSHSADAGSTWSNPIVVDDDNAYGLDKIGPDDTQPSIAVNNQGVVGIAWFDRRDNPDDLGWRVRLTVSLDGGKSVLPSVVVSSAQESFPMDAPLRLETSESREFRASLQPGGAPEVGGSAYLYDFGGGDTAGLVADAAGVFHAVWIDNRTGVPQMWTSAASVTPAARFVSIKRMAAHYARRLRPMQWAYARFWQAPLQPPRQDHSGTDLRDVTKAVDLSLMNGQFDPRSNSVLVRAVLTNISKQAVSSPLVLKLNSVSSATGRPRLARTAIEFQVSSSSKRLAPGQSTLVQPITVHLSDVRPITARDLDYTLAPQYLNLRGRVFARGK